MCRTRWVAWSLCCGMMLVSLRCTDASKDDGSAGRGGSSATGGSSGAGGHAASMGAGMDAGAAEDRGAGAGGSAGQAAGGAGGLGGKGAGGQSVYVGDSSVPDSGKAGAGGASADGNTPVASGDAAYDACLSDAMSAGQTVDDCTHCLCQADKCQAELNLATHDANANAVVICGEVKMCTDLCCLCGDSTCSFSNYATGPCAAEVETAAGVMPGKGVFVNGSTVSSKCARDATDDNACRRVALLAKCSLDRCADACPIATTCH